MFFSFFMFLKKFDLRTRELVCGVHPFFHGVPELVQTVAEIELVAVLFPLCVNIVVVFDKLVNLLWHLLSDERSFLCRYLGDDFVIQQNLL